MLSTAALLGFSTHILNVPFCSVASWDWADSAQRWALLAGAPWCWFCLHTNSALKSHPLSITNAARLLCLLQPLHGMGAPQASLTEHHLVRVARISPGLIARFPPGLLQVAHWLGKPQWLSPCSASKCCPDNCHTGSSNGAVYSRTHHFSFRRTCTETQVTTMCFCFSH